ncbi:MAG: NUDIX domain-containing protein [Curvibacter sp.]|nr:MAG: NUDIX domain-containing protein [Curvibacter sp.]
MPTTAPHPITPPARHAWAVCAGHFQPLRRHDLALIRMALHQAHRVVVVLAGAWLARSPAHPLGWGERADLIRASLPPRDAERLRFLPLRELGDAGRNARALRDGLAQLSGESPESVLRVVPADGPEGDWWQAMAEAPVLRIAPSEDGAVSDEAALRDLWFNADSPSRGLARLAPHLAPETLSALAGLIGTDRYEALRAEWRTLRQQREAWAVAPYPPVFVTVDAVVRCAGQVLLIRRDRHPGAGLLALPGGFLEQQDTLLESALREVQEETRLELPRAEWRAALQGVSVFDAPGRSQRGRTITHAHFFDLGQRPLPVVRGDDDAREALWVAQPDLAGLEEQFFDDHFVVLDHFLHLLPS